MKTKTALPAIAIALLLFFSGCSDEKPKNTSNIPPNTGGSSGSPGTSNPSGPTPLSFLQCLNSKGVQMYSAYWCDPCYKNIEQIFSGTGQNLKFKTQSEIEQAFNYFKNNIYKNCYYSGKCQKRNHFFNQYGSLYTLTFGPKTDLLPDTGCVSIELATLPTWKTPNGTYSGITPIETLIRDTGCAIPK
ncbi:MAG: hypothetical protein QXK06_03395 [Candidatus Diapherotrites archaeon]